MRERPREVVTLFGGGAVLWAGWFVLLEVTTGHDYSPHAAAALSFAQQILFWVGFIFVAAALLLVTLTWFERWRTGADELFEAATADELAGEPEPEPPTEL